MAKYLLAPSTDRPLGAIGGSVFQKQGGVFVIRNHNRPTDKKRIRQFVQRNRFASYQQRFKDLSPTDQATWASEAPNYPRTDSLGTTYYLTGPQLQQANNSFAFSAGLAPLNAIPAPVSPASFTWDTIAFAEPSDIFDIVADPDPVPTGFVLVVYATRPLSEGNLTSDTPYTLLGSVPAGTNTSSVNWFDSYITIYGAVNDKVGSQIFVVGHMLSLDTYVPGQSVYGSGFVE